MIDIDDIRSRWQMAAPFLDERGRRLFAANESLALGLGGVTATARATGLARSTINRGIQELRSAGNDIGRRVRRAGGGRKSAVVHQPDLPAALEALIESAIRGDPCSPLRWVSRSQRRLAKALRVDARLDGLDLCQRGEIWLGHGDEAPAEIGQSTRIGITRDADRVLRFYVRGSPFVSGPKALSP